MEKCKAAISLIAGTVFAYFGQYYVLYLLVTAAALFDLVTGICAAVISGRGLSSKVARQGCLKKIVMLISVAFGTFLDVLLPMCAAYAGITLPGGLIFSTVICVYITSGECISIMENICSCIGTPMPGWITRLLEQAKENLEQK